MSYLVAISCAREEREHAEILMAFLQEEIGDSAPLTADGSPARTVYFYLDDSAKIDAINQEVLRDTIENIYRNCCVMAAIVGKAYASRSFAALECQILTGRAGPSSNDVIMLLPGYTIPPGADLHLNQYAAEHLPADPRNSGGFERLREIARNIARALERANKKPPHPRSVRGSFNGISPAVKRHLSGLGYLFDHESKKAPKRNRKSKKALGCGALSKEASEGVLSTAVLLGRLEQMQRASAVATALTGLGATAADESAAQASADLNAAVDPNDFPRLVEHAIDVLFQLASPSERSLINMDFPLSLRVKLLLRLENYLVRHALNERRMTWALPLSSLTKTLQDIVLPDLGKNAAILTRQARAMLHQQSLTVAQQLSNCHWRCEGKPCEVTLPRGLPELEAFRSRIEIEIKTFPRSI